MHKRAELFIYGVLHKTLLGWVVFLIKLIEGYSN